MRMLETREAEGRAASQVKSADYDRMAPAYDLITRVISMGGNARSQRWFLPRLAGRDRVLTVGCGSIGFNAELARAHPAVTALDISPRMIAAARRRVEAQGHAGRMQFICADVMAYRPDAPFDAVLANFFLNTFAWRDCQAVLARLADLIRPGGILCIADEAVPVAAPARLLQAAFRPILVRLHHVWARHPLHPVYDYRPPLEAMGFTVVDTRRDPSDYIVSTVYRKPDA